MNKKGKIKGNGFKEIREILSQVALDIAELKESQKKTDEQLKRTDEEIDKLRESQKKTDEQIRETERLVNKTNRQVGELTDGWGKFVEGLVAPSIPIVFRKLGVEIDDISPRRKKFKDGRVMEVDVLASGRYNGKPVVFVFEVKSNLESRHVDEFLSDLRRFKKFFPEYAGYLIYGGVAGIRLGDGVEQYAEKKGLYVLIPSGETMIIANKKTFKPRIWR